MLKKFSIQINGNCFSLRFHRNALLLDGGETCIYVTTGAYFIVFRYVHLCMLFRILYNSYTLILGYRHYLLIPK